MTQELVSVFIKKQENYVTKLYATDWSLSIFKIDVLKKRTEMQITFLWNQK